MGKENIFLGTSGWSYREWEGIFYRKGEKRKLRAYSRVFRTVEIDSTFYRYPSKGMVMGWLRYSPSDFVFAANERPELLVGAGTVLSTENLVQARESGASFAVAPGFNPHIVEKSLELAFPFFPGIMTPTDIEKGLSVGVRTFKYFPAEASGGISMLKAMSAPYVHLGLRFIPTGGINIKNIEDYLGIKQVLTVGGTWIATTEMIASKQWESIKDNALAARKAATKIRGS